VRSKPTEIKKLYTKDSKEVLEICISKNYEEVLILGVKDGRIYMDKSITFSRLQTLGAIQELSMFLLEAGK